MVYRHPRNLPILSMDEKVLAVFSVSEDRKTHEQAGRRRVSPLADPYCQSFSLADESLNTEASLHAARWCSGKASDS